MSKHRPGKPVTPDPKVEDRMRSFARHANRVPEPMSAEHPFEKLKEDMLWNMIGDTGIVLSELKTGIAILLHLNRQSLSAYPGYKVLAQRTRQHRDTIKKAVHGRLQRHWRHEHRREGGKNTSNLYFPLLTVETQPETANAACYRLARQHLPDKVSSVAKRLQVERQNPEEVLELVMQTIEAGGAEDLDHLFFHAFDRGTK